MASFLYDALTQRLPKVLEPRYETLYWENGDLIPTQTDLAPGAREISYERLTEFGDADFVGDAATNIPIVDITVAEDRYPIYMVASGFPLSLQEERAYEAANLARQSTAINRFDRRMGAARNVIAQKTNKFTALGGGPNLNFPGAINNPLVPATNSSFDPNAATYATLRDFLIGVIEGLTDNLVSSEPTDMLVPRNLHKKMLALENTNGTKSVKKAIEEEYPSLNIMKIKEGDAAYLDAAQSGRPAAGKDRVMLFPAEEMVLNRHIENTVAQLVPEDYIRVDGMRRIYTMFSCITPAIFDYPQDCRYVDLVATT